MLVPDPLIQVPTVDNLTEAVATLRAHAYGCASLFAHSFLYSHLHHAEVATHVMCLGAEYGLDHEDLLILRVSGELHDIGKIPLLETIRATTHKSLARHSPEMAILRGHAEIGARGIEIMIRARPRFADTFITVAQLVRTHHEHWDGSGYPLGLAGIKIPLLSRMLAIADSAKAMTTPERQWRQPLTVDQMLTELRRCSGSQFDPELVELYARLIERNTISFPSLTLVAGSPPA